MRGSAAFRTGVAPGGVLAPAWVRDALWRNARAVPSLDLNFAANKSLVDATTGQKLVTFTRASSGTYVGSDGVLKTATTNLLLRSEEFGDASWTKNALQAFGSGSVANAIAAPNGTLTADYLAENTSLTEHFAEQFFTAFAGLTYTFSVYVKAGPNKTNVNLRFSTTAWGGAVSNQVRFNLINGAITVISGTGTGAATQLNDGWWRFSITATSTANGSPSARVHLIENNGTSTNYTGDGTSGIYLWGAQLEQSSTVGEYIPTTSTINSAPRFDHNPTTGESLGLLVEESRTNSIRNNTMVGAVAGTPGTLPTNWSQSNNTGLAANVIGTGVENGISYIDLRVNGTTTGSGQTNIYLETSTGIAALTAQTWSYAAYFKLQSGSLANVTNIRYALQENTSAGVAVTAGAQTLDISSTALGSYRPVFTRTLSGGATVAALQPYIQININTGLVIDFTLRIGPPQLEQGAFATSVIPTTGTTATRSADVASITGTNFSSWYNQSEGTVFADVNSAPVNNIAQLTFDISEGAGNERMFQRRNASGIVATAVLDNGVTQGDIGSVVIGASARYRSGFAYRLNDLEIVVNGSGSATDTSATIPTPDRLHIGQNYASGQSCNGTLRRLTFWPSRLPSSTLQAITQ